MWKVYTDAWCLLIEKGICLTGNVCILSKLVILLNHKKAMDTFQQWAGKVINCIFSNIFIANRLNILYFFNLYLRFTQVFYFILRCKLILITWAWHYVVPWLLSLNLECSVTNVIKWTWSKYLNIHRSKTQRFCLH